MKLLHVCIALLIAASGLEAAPKKEKLDRRIRNITTWFEELQLRPEDSIPASVLQRAQGIVILREFKAGFMFGGKAGGGVALARDKKRDRWSPPTFINTGEGSFGLQIGAQKMETVFVLMNEVGMKVLSDTKFRIGVDAAATAGPHDAEAEAKIGLDVPILVYGSNSGLYAGATIEGGFIVPMNEANAVYYDKPGITMNEILYERKVKPSSSGEELIKLLKKYTNK